MCMHDGSEFSILSNWNSPCGWSPAGKRQRWPRLCQPAFRCTQCLPNNQNCMELASNGLSTTRKHFDLRNSELRALNLICSGKKNSERHSSPGGRTDLVSRMRIIPLLVRYETPVWCHTSKQKKSFNSKSFRALRTCTGIRDRNAGRSQEAVYPHPPWRKRASSWHGFISSWYVSQEKGAKDIGPCWESADLLSRPFPVQSVPHLYRTSNKNGHRSVKS